jgi:hypothetical protein
VKHGYVDDTRAWPHSTIHRYMAFDGVGRDAGSRPGLHPP